MSLTSRSSISANSFARTCANCGVGVPAYPGRYPAVCPKCYGGLRRLTETALQSVSPRLALVLEAGIKSGSPWAGDMMCSPAVAVPLSVMEVILPGGVQEFLSLLEGPTEGGRYFRVEDPWSPVLVVEVCQDSNSVSIYASDAPTRWLGSDPREAMVEDGGWTVDGWADLDEYAGTVDGRVSTPDGKALPDDFVTALEMWVKRYGRKGALIKGELKPDHADLVVPVYSTAQLDLADLSRAHGVDAEIGLFDATTGLRWHPLRGTCESARDAQNELRRTRPPVHAVEVSEKEGSDTARTEACGVFVPVPARLHGKFPKRPEEDKSDPHVTLCYLGDLTKEQYSLAADVLARICKGVQPFVIEMTDYGEFTAANGAKIAHMIPRAVGGPPFETLHEKLVMAMREAGIPVDHHRDGAFKPHVTLAYLGKGESYDGPRPDGYWRCECLELWGAGVWLEGELGNTRCTLGTGDKHLVETGGTGGAGALSKVSRARVIRPVAGYGDGGATRAHGGFRFQIGHNRRRSVSPDVRLSIQNRKNAQRGLATRIKAAKDWHASPTGRRYHSALNRYNRGNRKGNQVTKPGKDGAPSDYSGALAEEYAKVVQNLDDAFDALVRKLIRIESLDILQDVDFDDEGGAIYLYFDPLMTQDEIELVLSLLKEENSMAVIVGSPSRMLPGEFMEADWWVVWAPYREASDGHTLVPDPRYYAINPSDRARGAPAPQTFVKPAMTPIDRIGQEIDADQLVQAIGESVVPTRDGPLMMFWSDAGSRTPVLRGAASGPAGKSLRSLVESAARGAGTLFLIRAHSAQAAREVISQGGLGRIGPVLTNDKRT